jgi:transposase InsO family protein
MTDRWAFEHLFDRVCREHGIGHRLTKPNHPWTNGPVDERSSGADESDAERCHREAVSLRNP